MAQLLRSKRLYLYAAMFAYLLIGFNKNINIYDEGLVLVGALRVFLGEVPYRDFWSIYGPGQFHLLAAAFELFGVSVLTARVVSLLTSFFLGFTVFKISEYLLSPKLAAVLGMATVVQVDYFGFHGAPVPTAVLLAMASSYYLIRYFREQDRRLLLYCGLFLGVTPLFRHDLGGYALFAQLLVLVPFLWMFKRREFFASMAPYVGGTALTFIPPFVYFLVKAGPSVLYDTLIHFPLRIFPEVRWLPYPPLLPPWWQQWSLLELFNHFQYYVPFVIGFAALVVAGARWLRHRPEAVTSVHWWAVVHMFLLGLLFFNQAAVRSDISHNLPTAIPVLVGIGLLLDAVHRFQWGGAARRLTQAVVIVSLLCLVLYPVRQKAANLPTELPGLLTLVTHEAPPGMYAFQLERARGIYGYPHFVHYEPVIEALQQRTDPDEPVFVGNIFHDRIFVNDVMFYFLADRPIPTKYHELHPGLADTRPIQEEIIEELEAAEVEHVVLWYAPEHFHHEPNASMQSTGVFLLSRFLRTNYFLVDRVWDYGIYQRVPEWSP